MCSKDEIKGRHFYSFRALSILPINSRFTAFPEIKKIKLSNTKELQILFQLNESKRINSIPLNALKKLGPLGNSYLCNKAKKRRFSRRA